MNRRKIKIYTIVITTFLSALFNIISNFYADEEKTRKTLSIISGVFGILTAVAIFLFANFDKKITNIRKKIK